MNSDGKIFVALHSGAKKQILKRAEQLASMTAIAGFKVHRPLIRYSTDFAKELKAFGKPVFADLKIGDVKDAVGDIIAMLAADGIELATVRADGVERIEAAVRAARGRCKIIGFTVPTDVDDEWCQREHGERIIPTVVRKVTDTVAGGGAGFTCSAHELPALRRAGLLNKGLLAVIPAIRPVWFSAPNDTQVRKATPTEAMQKGASYLVIGKPITAVRDHVEATHRIADEIEAVEVEFAN